MLHNLHPNQTTAMESFQQVRVPLGVALVVFRFGGKYIYLWRFKMQMFQEEKKIWKVMFST
jgi:hypothetical protein